MRIIVIALVAMLFGPIVVVAIQQADVPKFRYELPEGFAGWACVDFGVATGAPLERDADGVYVIEPMAEGVLETSSLPRLSVPPFPTAVTRAESGKPKPIALDNIQERGEWDTKRPESRYCLFFGSAAEAARFPRPATLAESRLGITSTHPRFEFTVGSLCAFESVQQFCLEATDVEKRRVDRAIGRAMAREGFARVATRCQSFKGVVVRYTADWSVVTHSSTHGPRFGFAEVRIEQPTQTAALATWSDTLGGSADAVANRFSRDLAAFFREARSSACHKP